MSGPLEAAWELNRVWPDAALTVVDDAGHGGSSMTDQLVAATDRFAERP